MYKNAIMGAIQTAIAAIMLLISLIPGVSATPVAFAATVSYVTVPEPMAHAFVVVVAGRYYKVKAGDNLSTIASRLCGQARDWTGIYAASRKHNLTAWNANNIQIGQSLAISCSYVPGMLDRAPRPKPVYHAQVIQTTSDSEPAPVYVPVYSQNVNPASYSGFQACVIARESGGNSQVMNSTGHYGLYQFSASTWAAYGGNPASFGNASVAEQNQVFQNAMAQGGQSNWSPYDGC